MKILHLSTYDISGGAARAAFRLHEGLLSENIESVMLVQDKLGGDAHTIGPLTDIAKFSGRYIRPRIDTLPLYLYRNRRQTPFHIQWIPAGISRRIREICPDIVHLHWTGDGFISIEDISALKTPLVWTLHDSWPFTGGCHIPYECKQYQDRCGACPQLGSSCLHDVSRLIWYRKKMMLNKINPVIISPSRWLAACAQNSSLFRDKRIAVVPNGIDLMKFQPVESEKAREILGLPLTKKIILFGAVNATSDPNKGFTILVDAVRLLGMNDLMVVVWGATGQQQKHIPDAGADMFFMGRLHEDYSLKLIYSAADVTAVPSIQENLSNIVLESTACGTPCVSFDIGGMPDMIDHRENGYLARPYDPADLACGINHILSDPSRAFGKRARLKAEQDFDIKHVALDHLALYRTILNQ